MFASVCMPVDDWIIAAMTKADHFMLSVLTGDRRWSVVAGHVLIELIALICICFQESKVQWCWIYFLKNKWFRIINFISNVLLISSVCLNHFIKQSSKKPKLRMLHTFVLIRNIFVLGTLMYIVLWELIIIIINVTVQNLHETLARIKLSVQMPVLIFEY